MNDWPCQLIRGGEFLGKITHDPHEDAGPCQVGRLEIAPGFEAVRGLFAEEFQEMARLCEADSGSAAARALESRLAEIQREIMEPGVRVVRLDRGESIEVEELHVEDLKVFWR